MLAGLSALASTARAQKAPTPTEGVVVTIDASELVVDLGTARGAEDGDVVELWRPLKLKHPVTGQLLTDRFLIGRLKLTQVRGTLSLARAEGALSRPPAVGDVVILPRSEAKAPQAPPTPIPLPAPSGTSKVPPVIVVPPGGSVAGDMSDPEAKALSDMFSSLSGSPPEARIRAYEWHVQKYPKGRFTPVLNEEAAALRAMVKMSKSGSEPTAPSYQASRFEPPAKVTGGHPLSLAIELPSRFGGAVVHYRTEGEVPYQSIPMRRAGQSYFAAALPAQSVHTPALEYFVEAVPDSGIATPVIGSAPSPNRVPVQDALKPSRERLLISAAVSTDYASFNAKRANDYVWQTEGYFGFRVHDEGFRALRSGFGVFRGQGGTLDELDRQGLDGRSVGLTYGYLEAEWAFSSMYAVVGRGVIGLRESGVGGGAQGFVRIGNDRKTNLLFGGEILGGIGLRGITQLEWLSIPRWPITLRVEVTNQPAGESSKSILPNVSNGSGEIGARTIAQVGYRLVDGLTVAGRVSYQGRTINHAGPGAGAAVSYEW